MSIIKSFLIGDSPINGKDQVLSADICYPWEGCKIADEMENRNERIIAEAMQFARQYEFSNIREVRREYKDVYYPKWKMVGRKCVRTRVVPFKP